MYMNPQRGRHMTHDMEGGAQNQGQGPKHPHSIHIHHAGDGEPHHGNPHHVHVHHADGSHEHSEHGNFKEAMDHAHSMSGGGESDHGEDEGQLQGEDLGAMGS